MSYNDDQEDQKVSELNHDRARQEFSGLADILKQKRPDLKKAPAYPWQDLALRIIQELAIPPFKKSAVFKVCRDYSKDYVEKCLNETKELAQGKERWRYFFKVIDTLSKSKNQN